jgi:serine/threonine protein kinase
MKNSPRKPEPANASSTGLDWPDPSDWGFEVDGPGDAWLAWLREASRPQTLGSIGPYELVEEISRGGQGVVFRARQPGTGRDIAIKRLLAGSLSTSNMRQRFLREIEASAALSHPNIITVYGMDEVDGVPVLAMEWVDGLHITQWARGEDPSEGQNSRELLAVFLRVCAAVEHAHSRGILHRDLKPSNILVDGASEPRLLDFGLAKRFSLETVRLDEGGTGSLESLTSGFVGTPGYAAPELLQPEPAQADVRADVYSLAVVLYELLGGSHPFARSGGVAELLQAIEGGPMKLVDPARPRSRELDSILRRALEYRRELRYPSVAEFAADLNRYLLGQPVQAMPPSTWYHLHKYVLRHRVALAFVSIVFVLLAGFSVYALIKNQQLQEQRDTALESQAQAQREARRAQLVMNFLLDDVIRSANPSTGKGDINLREALNDAADSMAERFRDQPDTEAIVRRMLGGLYHGLGDDQAALEMLREARRLQQTSGMDMDPGEEARVLLGLGLCEFEFGQMKQADAYFREAIEVGEEHPEGRPVVPAAYSNLASSFRMRGLLKEAEDLAHKALEWEQRIHPEPTIILATIYTDLANIRITEDRFDEAEELMLKAVDICRKIGSRGQLADRLMDLSTVYFTAKRPVEFERTMREALQLQMEVGSEHHPLTALAQSNLGIWLIEQGRLEEAEEILLKAEKVEGPQRSRVCYGLAGLYRRHGDYQEAERYARKALELDQPFIEENAVHSIGTQELLGQILLDANRPEEAEEVLGLAIERGWSITPPRFTSFHHYISSLVRQGMSLEADEIIQDAVDLVLEEGGEWWFVIEAQIRLAYAFLDEGDPELAEDVLREAEGIFEEFGSDFNYFAGPRMYTAMAETLDAQGRSEEAREVLGAALERCTEILGEHHAATVDLARRAAR